MQTCLVRHTPKTCPAGRVLAALLGAGLAALAHAQADPFGELLTTPGSAGLGFTTRLQRSPYIGGRNYDVAPVYLYEGERAFLSSGRAGLKLMQDATQRLDVFVEERTEGFPGTKAPSSTVGMAARHASLDAGVGLRYRQPWGTLRAEYVHDTGNISRGGELRGGYSYDWRSGPLQLRSSVMLSFRDARLNNYYYGVLPAEATPARAAYEPGAGVNTALSLQATYELSRGWRLLGGVSATVLSSRIRNSPVVQRSVLPGAFVGAVYDFDSPAKAWAEPKTPTYLKAYIGRATEDGCHLIRIMTLQCAAITSTNQTSIMGVQIGKPFAEKINGWPLDLIGYAGLAYHAEHGLQADGVQLDLYMKAVYSGFPWSDRIRTRLGMGMGVSLANRVPWVEASSQAIRGRETSRLLNYLDPSVDVSVGDVVGKRSLKDTYFGFGVSHRSGFFGASRLLGDVNGGSNYIYTYVETVF